MFFTLTRKIVYVLTTIFNIVGNSPFLRALFIMIEKVFARYAAGTSGPPSNNICN